jgi:hypothetical protein
VNVSVAGAVSFVLVVVFLIGLAVGTGMSTPDKQMQFVSRDALAAIRF